MVPPRVLLVENDPKVGAQLEQALDHRFLARRAETLEEGLRLLGDEPFQAVLLDLSLPDVPGLNLVVRLRAVAPQVPLVTLVDPGDEETGMRAVRAGAQDYLVRGQVTPELLERTLRHAVERFHFVRRLEEMAGELREANQRLERLSVVDPLTGVLNRRGLEQALMRELNWSRREGSRLMALLVDLDDFKRVNDTLGHAVGDVVLQEVARQLQESIRETDHLARIGGDEFMILLPRTRVAEGMRVAERIRAALAEKELDSGVERVHLTASIGLVVLDEPGAGLEELVARTSRVLGHSKRRGKNRVTVYQEEPSPAADESGIPEVLRAVRQGDRFRTLSQPIVRLSDGEVVACELVSRLDVEGYRSPLEYFRVCREGNLLTLADYHSFRANLADSRSLPHDLRRHVNLFPSTLLNLTAGRILEDLPEEGSFCVEISEQQLVGDPSVLVDDVRILRQAGVHIALDNLGYGRSSLESLVLLEPDLLKTERRWVAGIARDPSLQHYTRRLVKVARTLGARVVASGVETPEDRDALGELGVEYGQGFLWGEPREIR